MHIFPFCHKSNTFNSVWVIHYSRYHILECIILSSKSKSTHFLFTMRTIKTFIVGYYIPIFHNLYKRFPVLYATIFILYKELPFKFSCICACSVNCSLLSFEYFNRSNCSMTTYCPILSIANSRANVPGCFRI